MFSLNLKSIKYTNEYNKIEKDLSIKRITSSYQWAEEWRGEKIGLMY